MQIRSTQQYANLFSFVVIERIMSKQANLHDEFLEVFVGLLVLIDLRKAFNKIKLPIIRFR